MIDVELIHGGTFQLDETKVKKAYLDNKLKGIVIESENGFKLTIKDSEQNRVKWNPTLNTLN